ncbi:phage antirepressor N-terminal domain-containing protein [Tsukamurella sp. DT100]|uniref:phage antirepressor N-terminal domain-containing protein n=1 Tax=Tsukamurella sp. DT100 TaxID=3393415 RepID=UPI003CE75C53
MKHTIVTQDQVKVPGSTLPLYTDGKSLAAFRPIVEHFGLDYSGQLQKLKSKSWAVMENFSTTGSDGKTYSMVGINRRTLGMWLATLDENRVREELRAELIAYQSEAADALDKFFHEGAAINPRATEHQLNAAIFQARAQMELCQSAKGLIHPDHLEARARVVLARGLGEHAELDAKRRPLYTQDFLRGKNLTRAKMKSVAGVFGKRVKAAYIELHGREPEMYPLDMQNGQVREVRAYTEEDRPLMERVWLDHYGDQHLPLGG